MTCKIDKRPKLTYFPNRKRHLPLLVRLENQEKIYSSENFERLFIRYKGEAYPRGESVQKFCQRNNAPYTNSFWDQIFLYRKDGNYTIDNSLAEGASGHSRTKGRTPCPLAATRWHTSVRHTSSSCPLANYRGTPSWNISKDSLKR